MHNNAHSSAPAYRCPLCQLPLHFDGAVASCDNKHQFDRAKEGYINLLPVQKKRSKQPGDSPEMVQARRQFFASEHYQFLRQALAEQIHAQRIPEQASALNILDLGCGEGFYTHYVHDYIKQHIAPTTQLNTYAVDIAKTAVRYASKRYAALHCCVASNADLPFAEQQFDVVYKVFAPMSAQETARILKPQGVLISVGPGAKHLWQLKSLIYDTPREHTPEHIQAPFTRQSSQRLTTTIDLPFADLESLIMMTPFAWKMRTDIREQLQANTRTPMTFDFDLSVWSVR